MSPGTVVVFLAVCLTAFLAGRSLWKDKKNGKGCGGNCAGCSGCGQVHPRK